MRTFYGPRAGTRAYIALVKLHSIGGQGKASVWMTAAAWTGSTRSFELAVSQLLAQRMIYQRLDLYILTEEGLGLLGIPVGAVPVTAPALVGPRYNVGIRPLSANNIPKVRVMREGAFDYRDIPSLHGAERVAFKSSLSVVSADRK